jgi:hypothetical protein
MSRGQPWTHEDNNNNNNNQHQGARNERNFNDNQNLARDKKLLAGGAPASDSDPDSDRQRDRERQKEKEVQLKLVSRLEELEREQTELSRANAQYTSQAGAPSPEPLPSDFLHHGETDHMHRHYNSSDRIGSLSLSRSKLPNMYQVHAYSPELFLINLDKQREAQRPHSPISVDTDGTDDNDADIHQEFFSSANLASHQHGPAPPHHDSTLDFSTSFSREQFARDNSAPKHGQITTPAPSHDGYNINLDRGGVPARHQQPPLSIETPHNRSIDTPQSSSASPHLTHVSIPQTDAPPSSPDCVHHQAYGGAVVPRALQDVHPAPSLSVIMHGARPRMLGESFVCVCVCVCVLCAWCQAQDAG